MKQNKKVISLITVLAMILTMFSSFVVRAEGEEVYTKATETETGLSLEIGYKGFADLAVGATEVNVKIPEGFTAAASDITVDSAFAGAIPNVSDGVIKVSHMGMTGDYNVSDGVIATVALTWAGDKPEVTTEYSFEITKFKFTLPDFSSLDLSNGVTANVGTYKYKVAAVEPTTQHVYVYGSEVVDGKATLTIGYKNFADLAVGATEVNVKIPEGFTAAASDITVDSAFAGAVPNVSDGVIKVSHMGMTGDYNVSDGVIATVVITMNDGFEMPEDGVMAEITKFKFTLPDFSSLDLSNGVATYVTPVTVAGSTDDPTPTPDAGDKDGITAITLDATAKSAKAGATVTFTYEVEGKGDVVATAKMGDTDVDVTVKNGKITLTVPADAVEGDVIDVTVASADGKVSATATVTVIDPVIEIEKINATEVTMNGGEIEMFKPVISAVEGKDITTKFAAEESYRLVFDFVDADGTTIGHAVVSVTGAQVAALADDSIDDPEIYATALGAETATVHFEDTTGKVIQ